MVIRTGVLGLSEGNGHPFSFSAIINGYNEAAFVKAGWPGILDYLQRQPATRFGIDGAFVTHAWTQEPELTAKLCAACRIEHACSTAFDMLGKIDALIIARDDWESHAELAMPFLRSGIPVFIDKPLTLDRAELAQFLPYLETGKLMSCSGLRYAIELDELRLPKPEVGSIKLVSGTVLNGLEKYGVHLIEAVSSLGGPFARPVAMSRLEAPHDSFLLHFESGLPFHLDCLGRVGKTFHLNVFGELGHQHFDLHDNFSAFRRTLEHFFTMVRSSVAEIDPSETSRIMRLLVAGRSLPSGSTVQLKL